VKTKSKKLTKVSLPVLVSEGEEKLSVLANWLHVRMIDLGMLGRKEKLPQGRQLAAWIEGAYHRLESQGIDPGFQTKTATLGNHDYYFVVSGSCDGFLGSWHLEVQVAGQSIKSVRSQFDYGPKKRKQLEN